MRVIWKDTRWRTLPAKEVRHLLAQHGGQCSSPAPFGGLSTHGSSPPQIIIITFFFLCASDTIRRQFIQSLYLLQIPDPDTDSEIRTPTMEHTQTTTQSRTRSGASSLPTRSRQQKKLHARPGDGDKAHQGVVGLVVSHASRGAHFRHTLESDKRVTTGDLGIPIGPE